MAQRETRINGVRLYSDNLEGDNNSKSKTVTTYKKVQSTTKTVTKAGSNPSQTTITKKTAITKNFGVPRHSVGSIKPQIKETVAEIKGHKEKFMYSGKLKEKENYLYYVSGIGYVNKDGVPTKPDNKPKEIKVLSNKPKPMRKVEERVTITLQSTRPERKGGKALKEEEVLVILKSKEVKILLKEKIPQLKQELFKPQQPKESNMKIIHIILEQMPNKIQDIIEQLIKESKKISLLILIKEEALLKKQRKPNQKNMSLLKKNIKKKQMILTKEKLKLKIKQSLQKIKESMIQINIIPIEIKRLKKLNFPRKIIIYSMIQIIAQFMVITVKEINLILMVPKKSIIIVFMNQKMSQEKSKMLIPILILILISILKMLLIPKKMLM